MTCWGLGDRLAPAPSTWSSRLFHHRRQRVVVQRDERAQIRGDGVRVGEARLLRGGVVHVLRDRLRLRVVPPVPEGVERDHVPRGPLLVGEEQRLGARALAVETALQPPLFYQEVALLGECLEHLQVHEPRILDVVAERGQRWPLDVDVLVPRDEVVELPRELLPRHARCTRGALAPAHALGAVVLREAPRRVDDEEVPSISLRVADDERQLVAARGHHGQPLAIEVDQLEQPPRRRLNEDEAIELRAGRSGLRIRGEQRQREEQCHHENALYSGGSEFTPQRQRTSVNSVVIPIWTTCTLTKRRESTNAGSPRERPSSRATSSASTAICGRIPSDSCARRSTVGCR